MPGIELNIPLKAPLEELVEGHQFEVAKYDDELGSLTNLYVGSHFDCPGRVSVQEILPAKTALLLFEGHAHDWDFYGDETSTAVKFLIEAKHEKLERGFD